MPTPKSKESRRKIRRWSFQVKATKEGQTASFVPPAMTIGAMDAARAAALEIERDLSGLPTFVDATMSVVPIGHETVSLAVLNQIKGLNEHIDLLTQLAKSASTEIVAATKPELEPESVEFNNAVTETMGRLFMEIRGAARRQSMIDAGLDPDAVVDAQDMAIPEGYGAVNQADGTGDPVAAEEVAA